MMLGETLPIQRDYLESQCKVKHAIDNGLVVRREGETSRIGVVLNGHGGDKMKPRMLTDVMIWMSAEIAV